MTIKNDCPLCATEGGRVLWRDGGCRVVLAQDAERSVAVCRVITTEHVMEMTDLTGEARARLMQVVYATEQTLRQVLQPDKINLAALGNQVPHLHWHVIARFHNDAFFPDPIWASPRRTTDRALPVNVNALVEGLKHWLGQGESR